MSQKNCTSRHHYHGMLLLIACLISWRLSLAQTGQLSLDLHMRHSSAHMMPRMLLIGDRTCAQKQHWSWGIISGALMLEHSFMRFKGVWKPRNLKSFRMPQSDAATSSICYRISELWTVTAVHPAVAGAHFTLSATEWCSVSGYVSVLMPLTKTTLACSATYTKLAWKSIV